MAKLKFDVSGIDDIPDTEQAPVGTYRAKVGKVELTESKAGNQMLVVQYELTHTADGKKIAKGTYGNVWDRPIIDHDNEFVQARFKDFITATVGKAKGEIDLNKLAGTVVQVKLKSDTDQDGEYRPRVGKTMPYRGADDEDEAPEDDEEPEEVEGDTEEPEDEEEGESVEDAIADLDRAGLKAFIKENELTLSDTIKKSWSDDKIREEILAAWPEDEEEPEDEDAEDEEDDDEEDDDDAAESDDEDDEDDEEDADEAPDYESWSVTDLKKELGERELTATGAKKVLVARLKKDDSTSAV